MGDVNIDNPKYVYDQSSNYDLGTNLIKPEDLFRLLKKRHNQRWASYKAHSKEISEGIFYETICLLENLERQLGMVYNRAYPTRDEFLIALEHGDQQRLNQIIKFYEELRVERDLIEYAQPTHTFGKNVKSYIDYLKRYPDSLFWKKGEGWKVETFHHEAIFDFFETYLGGVHLGQIEPTALILESAVENQSELEGIGQQQIESKKIKKIDTTAVAPLTEELTLEIFKQFDEGKREFSQFLAKHKSLKVMCLEVTLTPQEATSSQNTYALDKKRISLQGCFKLLADQYDLLAEYSRIEIGFNSSLVLQLVLLFKGYTDLDTRRVRAEVQNGLEKQMGADIDFSTQSFKVDVRDFGNLIHSLDTNYKDIIQARSKSAKRAFEYWVLGYLYRVDFFLKPDLVCIADCVYVDRHLQHSVSLRIIESSLDTGRNINYKQHHNKEEIERVDDFIDLDFNAEDKQIWKNNNLPKQAKDDLTLLALVYSQYKKMLPVASWRERESCLKLLLSIEHFMRLIQHNPVQVLVEECLPQSQIEKFPLKCLSQQAKQYLVIGQQLKQLSRSLTEQIADLAFVGWRVRLFLHLFIENVWGFQISRDGIAGLKSCLANFKDLEHYRTPEQEECLFLFDVERQEAVSVKRNQAKAKDYLNKAIIQDVFAFRLVFSYQPNKAFTTEDNITAFNAVLTDFLKNLKRTRKISGESLVAYVGTRIFIDKVLNADITLIFSAQNLSDYDEKKNKEHMFETREKVIKHWENYISIKEMHISESKKVSAATQSNYMNVFKNGDLKVASYYLIASLHRPLYVLHIKHHDTQTLRLFKTDVVDFYSAQGLLCKWNSDMLKNLTPSDEGRSSRSMDQFLKGHVASVKSKPLKSKLATTLAHSKIKEAKGIDEELADKKKQVISMDE